MLTGGPHGSPDSSDPMVDGVRHPLDSGCAGYILYSAYPVLMGRCGFREILCKAAMLWSALFCHGFCSMRDSAPRP